MSEKEEWVPCYTFPTMKIFDKDSKFKCRNNQFLSSVLLCDDQNDCKDTTSQSLDSDELICSC